MNKKGQVFQNLQGLIIPLIGVGIVLVVGFLILAESKEKIVDLQSGDWCSDSNTLYGTYSLNRTGTTLTCCNSSACVFNHVTGATGVGNYTYNVSASVCCNVTAATGVVDCTTGNTKAPTTKVDCAEGNITSIRGTFAYNGTGSTQNALSDIPGWLSIIVITVIGAILIGLVAMFGRLRT